MAFPIPRTDWSSEQEVCHDRPGKADINTEFRHSSNNRFILHDSEGFEPGENAKFDTVKRFIEERTRSEMPPNARLHVIWWVQGSSSCPNSSWRTRRYRICISAPVANDHAIETGVEEIFKMAQERSECLVLSPLLWCEIQACRTTRHRYIHKIR